MFDEEKNKEQKMETNYDHYEPSFNEEEEGNDNGAYLLTDLEDY
jgi:hypothetical protein